MTQSERLFLNPDIDIHIARKARNHPSIKKWCRQYTLISQFDQVKWADKIETDPTIKMFGICKHDGMQPQIGVCGFTSIDNHNRSAEFSLYINHEYHNKGFGQEALILLLDHGFYDFGFHRIWGEVFDKNPALKIFQSLGFKINGILRHTYFREGAFIDSTMVDLLEYEWKSRRY